MAKDYLTPLQVGANIGASYSESKRMRDIFSMEKDKFQLQKDEFLLEKTAADEVSAVYQQENQHAQSRSHGAQVFAQLRNLAGQPASVRKTTAPVIFAAIEKAIDAPLADNLKQLITTGKPEEIGPMFDGVIREYASDPNQTLESSKQFLTSPIASADLIGNLSRKMVAQSEQEALTGPTPTPRQDKLAMEKAKRMRMIEKLEAVGAKRSGTKAGAFALEKAQSMRAELGKMETLLTGKAAEAEGFRPGTTVRETGDGQISVVQGPDDSGSGATGPGGLKATDERFLKQLAASEFDTEINLQTGEIKFKNRDEAALANQITADATRIFVEAKGQLTLAEAYQQAKKKAGGGTPPGGGTGNPYDQF